MTEIREEASLYSPDADLRGSALRLDCSKLIARSAANTGATDPPAPVKINKATRALLK